jgi:hypothetical protein
MRDILLDVRGLFRRSWLLPDRPAWGFVHPESLQSRRHALEAAVHKGGHSAEEDDSKGYAPVNDRQPGRCNCCGPYETQPSHD